MATTTYPHIPPSAPSLPPPQAVVAVSRIFATPTNPAHHIWRWTIPYARMMTHCPLILIVSIITMAQQGALIPRLRPCM